MYVQKMVSGQIGTYLNSQFGISIKKYLYGYKKKRKLG